MKVWHGNKNGKVEALVAAANQKEAARLLHTSVGDIRDYYHVTSIPELVMIANQVPGTVYVRLYREPNSGWYATI